MARDDSFIQAEDKDVSTMLRVRIALYGIGITGE
jgi:hypothetical protein